VRRKSVWGETGWPWEMELLALVFVIAAIAIPIYLQGVIPEVEREQEDTALFARVEEAATANQATSWKDLTPFFWSIGIVGLYIALLIISGTSLDFMSTPFTHLFSPLIFACITYYRLLDLAKTHQIEVVSGVWWEIVTWFLGALIMTLMLARLRMRRHLRKFAREQWEVVSKTLLDKSFFQLLVYFRPLVYFPRVYRVCEHGIFIEGWFYIMPIPFEAIKSVDAARRAHLMSSGYYLATSSRVLVRIMIAEYTDPVFISPKDRHDFLEACEKHLAPKRRGTHAGATKNGAPERQRA
jgi:hypothetical protein